MAALSNSLVCFNLCCQSLVSNKYLIQNFNCFYRTISETSSFQAVKCLFIINEGNINFSRLNYLFVFPTHL